MFNRDPFDPKTYGIQNYDNEEDYEILSAQQELGITPRIRVIPNEELEEERIQKRRGRIRGILRGIIIFSLVTSFCGYVIHSLKAYDEYTQREMQQTIDVRKGSFPIEDLNKGDIPESSPYRDCDNDNLKSFIENRSWIGKPPKECVKGVHLVTEDQLTRYVVQREDGSTITVYEIPKNVFLVTESPDNIFESLFEGTKICPYNPHKGCNDNEVKRIKRKFEAGKIIYCPTEGCNELVTELFFEKLGGFMLGGRYTAIYKGNIYEGTIDWYIGRLYFITESGMRINLKNKDLIIYPN
ncbi:MAG: hypothetical protein QXM68_04130 [Candidatus Aenigmatarchaeota archaeon]|nr:hypothetical protein [Candidatus Aenigmarchaeota archaeon]